MTFYRQLVCLFLVVASRSLAAQEADPNSVTPDEEEIGFELLFNGRDFEGWKNPGGWVVENGTFAFRERGGGLIYRAKKIPDDFELQFQWKVPNASKSRTPDLVSWHQTPHTGRR